VPPTRYSTNTRSAAPGFAAATATTSAGGRRDGGRRDGGQPAAGTRRLAERPRRARRRPRRVDGGRYLAERPRRALRRIRARSPRRR
tara:strand:- start:2107 stop:2367 length:261 start_codon:yes stop_codon:yes gene_type:complete